MGTAPTTAATHNSLLVLAAVVGAAIPGAFITMMADSIGKEPNGPVLYFSVLSVSSLCGIIAYKIALLIDPNSPKLALLPAILVSFVASALAFAAALIWFIP